METNGETSSDIPWTKEKRQERLSELPKKYWEQPIIISNVIVALSQAVRYL
jgi:hypothetical protein